MDAAHAIRREILRLAATQHKSIAVSTKRLSAFYNVPETQVRAEIASLAEEKKIRVSAWDGRQVSPVETMVRTEFVERSLGNGQVFVQGLG